MGYRWITFVMVMAGLSVLFYYGGLIDDTGSLIPRLLNPQDFSFSGTWKLILLNIGIGVFGAFVGIYTKNAELALMTAVIPHVIVWLWDFIKVYNVIRLANGVLANLILGPVIFLFVLTIFDVWRGRD